MASPDKAAAATTTTTPASGGDATAATSRAGELLRQALAVVLDSPGGAVGFAGMTLIALVVIYLLKHRTTIYRLLFHPKPFPNVPMNLPPKLFFGHADVYGKEQLSGMKTLMVDNADPKTGQASFYVMEQPCLSVLRGEDVRKVLLSGNYREAMPLLGKHFDAFMGKHAIVTLMGKAWKDHRREIARSFEHKVLVSNVGHFSRVSTTLVQTIVAGCRAAPDDSNRVTHDVLPLMKKVTMDAFGLAALSHRFDCAKSFATDEVAAAFELLLHEMTLRMFHEPLNPTLFFYSFPSERNRKWHKCNDLVNNMLKGIVLKHKQELEAGAEKEQEAEAEGGGGGKAASGAAAAARPARDMLTTLLKKTGDGKRLTDESIVDNLKTFFFGGFDTTAITLAHALFLLSQSPEWEAKIVAEVREVLEVDPHAPDLANRLRTATYEDLAKLRSTEAVVKETLRLYPSAQLTTRHATKDMVISGTHVPKGTMMMVPIWHVHRSALNWKDPEEFRPERFVVDGVDARAGARANSEGAHPYSWIPFSGGQRNCVGQRFAMLEAVASLATLVYHVHFEFTRDARKEPLRSISTSFVHTPVGGIPMHMTPRQHA